MFVVGNNIVVFEDHGQMVVKVTDPAQRRAVVNLPYAVVKEGEGQTLVQLPWCEDACRLLQNVGISTVDAAPVFHKSQLLVEGVYKPMWHQLFTAAFITLNPRCYVLSDPRTGKTGCLLIAMDYMQRYGIVPGAFLIITTVTTMRNVWENGITSTLPGVRVQLVNGKGREKQLENPADYYVTNYDSIRLSQEAFAKAVRDGRIAGVVIDELTHVGNVSSQRYQAINAIVNRLNVKHVIGITGSPAENNVKTVFGMCKMINATRLPCTTQKAWIGMTTYAYGTEPFMRQISSAAPKIIHEAMQPAVRFNKKDIIDLPPVVTQTRSCSLSSEQMKLRLSLRQQAIALLDSGEVITAANGGVLYQKLMQVSQGIAIGEDGTVHQIDSKDRTNTILEAIGETYRKVVVFCCYKGVIAKLATEIANAGYTVGVVDGSITGERRAKVLHSFQYEKDPHVLICHPTTTAYGVELSAADTLIFNGPPPLGGFIYAQALERLSSAKQTADKISIIRIVASPEEKKFFKSLDMGRDMGSFISTLFEDFRRGLA